MVLVQQGDSAAFRELFARHQVMLHSYIQRRTQDSEVSADLFQEAFLRVWRSASTYKPGQPFRPWLFRITGNLLRDRFRTSTRRIQTVETEDLDRVHATIPQPLATTDLERAIAKLPDSLREAFLLGAVHGMDHNEVADALDISPSNARARISRARARLRVMLTDAEKSP